MFGNVILLIFKEYYECILVWVLVYFDIKGGIVSGVMCLLNDCGLVFKVLGIDSVGVKNEI